MARFRYIHVVSAPALAAALFATPAVAQSSDAEDGGTTEAEQGNDRAINAIVVTARRQEETLQDAALAIDAVDAESLANQSISNAVDITRAVPAITFVNGGGQTTSVFLRGVGNMTNNQYYDSAISSNYDGVPLARGDAVVGAAFYDLQRVEILKGPQGILYGRNATGGAVNIVPARPEIGLTGAGVNAGYGNYDAIALDAYVNVATSENSAIRVAGMHQSRDGINRDGTDDLNRTGVRAQFLVEPTDTLTIRIAGDWTNVRGVGPGAHYLGHYQAGSFVPSGLDTFEGLNTTAGNAYRTTVLGAPGFGFLEPMNQSPEMDFEYWGVNAEITLETEIGDLTFIPAYRRSSGEAFIYGPAFNTASRDSFAEQVTGEVRLSGDIGAFDYIVGGFFLDENVAATNQFNQEFVLPIQDYSGGTTSLAGFGQLTFNVSDELRLVGGLRYTNDKKEINGSITNFITFCGASSPPPVTPPASFGEGCHIPGNLPHFPNLTDPQSVIDHLIAEGWIAPSSTLDQLPPFYPLTTGVGTILRSVTSPSDSGSFDRVTWKAGVEFDASPDSLIYASVETGYRAGGFQLSSGNTTYNPEYITAYTLGSKNRFLDDMLQINLEAFLWKYRDQQINYFTVDNDGVLNNTTTNVGRSEIMGFDVDIIARPTSTTTLSGKLQFLDTEYQGLLLRTAPPRDNYNCPSSLTGETTTDGAPVIEFDCSGRPLLYSPRWTLNLGVEQVVPLAGSLELVGAVNTAWRDEQWGGFNFLPEQLIPAYWTTGATLTLRDVDNGWRIQAYINNIEDRRRISLPQASPIGFITASYTDPMTYGLRIGAEF